MIEAKESKSPDDRDVGINVVVHTPGPWTVEPNVMDDGDLLITPTQEASPDGGYPYPVAWMADDGGERTEQIVKDAKLIAASPSLLSACREVFPFLEWLSLQEDDAIRSESRKMMTVLRDAIKRTI